MAEGASHANMHWHHRRSLVVSHPVSGNHIVSRHALTSTCLGAGATCYTLLCCPFLTCTRRKHTQYMHAWVYRRPDSWLARTVNLHACINDANQSLFRRSLVIRCPKSALLLASALNHFQFSPARSSTYDARSFTSSSVKRLAKVHAPCKEAGRCVLLLRARHTTIQTGPTCSRACCCFYTAVLVLDNPGQLAWPSKVWQMLFAAPQALVH